MLVGAFCMRVPSKVTKFVIVFRRDGRLLCRRVVTINLLNFGDGNPHCAGSHDLPRRNALCHLTPKPKHRVSQVRPDQSQTPPRNMASSVVAQRVVVVVHGVDVVVQRVVVVVHGVDVVVQGVVVMVRRGGRYAESCS